MIALRQAVAGGLLAFLPAMAMNLARGEDGNAQPVPVGRGRVMVQAPSLVGTWSLNGNGFTGELVLKTGKSGRLEGTMYGEDVWGTFNANTGCLSLHRLRQGAIFQAYKGYLLPKPDGPGDLLTLVGTFVDISDARRLEYGWVACLPKPLDPATIKEASRPLADDMKAMQGDWEVKGPLTALAQELFVPNGTLLNTKGVPVTIRGNALSQDGKVLATLANDLPLPDKQKEIALPGYRLLTVTRPDGKGMLCAYRVQAGSIEITSPHNGGCRRGRDSFVTLQRPAK